MDCESMSFPFFRHFINLLFGVALPALCLTFDPIVFQGGLSAPMLGNYVVVGWSASCIAFASLGSWIVLRRWPALHAGLMFGSALFATCLGIVMLPISLLGLMACIGVLGFAPFLTAWIYGREARAAWKLAGRMTADRAWLLCGVVYFCSLPWLAKWGIDAEVSRLMLRSPSEAEARELRVFGHMLPVSYFDRYVEEYFRAQDPVRRQAMADAYRAVTGGEIEDRRLAMD